MILKDKQSKVTSELSADCKHDLEILASCLQLNLQETMQFVLERHVPAMLVKEMQKKLKLGNNGNSANNANSVTE